MADDAPIADEFAEFEETPKRRLSRKAMIALGGLGSAVALGAILFITTDSTPEPEELFVEAITLLDAGDVRRAGNVARYLRDHQYRDLDFGGGVAFVLGMSEFELGSRFSADQHTRQRHYRAASEELRVAFQEGLTLDRRPRWAYATGLSLYRLGRLAEAEPRLVEALDEYPEGHRPIALALAQCDLGPEIRSPERLDRALRLADSVLADPEASETEQADAWLLRVEAVLRKDGVAAAIQWVGRASVPELLNTDPRMDIVQARLAIEDGRAGEASLILREILSSPLDPPEVARAAAFLLGQIYERAGDEEAAITAFRRVVDDYDTGDETVVAAVHLGDLLRLPPRTLYEDALRAYVRAVQIEIEPEHFRNRYASLDELRNRVRRAWQIWLDDGQYQWAIKLAEQMAPLFQPDDAAEMAAEATQSMARNLEAQYLATTDTERVPLEAEMLAAWRASGQAYATLAETRVAQSGYPDAVWTSAEHFTLGHDFESALEQTEKFLNTRDESRRPRALVNYGRLQMSLHRPGDQRLDEAANTFTQMLADFPTSDAAFDARFALGECMLELNRPEDSQRHWKTILDSDVLTPDSLVWQDALASLGDLYFHTGEQYALAARRAEQAGDSDAARSARQQADFRWASAVAQLTAYLARTPDTRRSATARYWLAKSLQRSIELPQSQLDAAETNNARLELERQIESALKGAISEFRVLKDTLEPKADNDRLAPVQRRVLRDSVFEIAHTLFKLGDHKNAIDAYSEAVNSYPNDPQVLLAYLQSARCFDKMGRPSDARSQVKRAMIIQEQLAEPAYDQALTSFSSPEWELWLARTLELMTEPEGS